jgi:O-antigen/teichoic acid export membrane protein
MGALGESSLDEVFPPSPGEGGEGPGGGTTEQRVLRSTFASYAIQLARLGINFGAKIALMHLVLPHGHGVYELALRIVTIASAIRDLGLPYHLVRDRRRPYGTVLAATSALAALVTVLLIATAPLFGRLAPELPSVLRVFSFWILLDGLAVVPRVFFERELTIGHLIGPEIWRGAIVGIVSIGLAWMGFGYWSLVVGDLIGAGLLASYSWVKVWGKIPLRVETELLPSLLRSSFLLFLIWLALQLVTYVDVFIVEAIRDTDTVGLYSRTYWLVFLVATFFYPRAFFPTLVEYKDDRAKFIEFFRLSTVQLLGCQVIGSYFLFFNANRVVLVLFGDGWLGAVPILRALSFVPFLGQFAILGGEALKAEHQDQAWLCAIVLNLIALVGIGILFTQQWGAPGMAVANYFLVGDAIIVWRIRKILGPWAKILLGDVAFLYAVPFPFYVCVAWIFPGLSWWRFIGSLVAAALSLALFAWRYHGAFRAFFKSERKSGHRRSPAANV